MDPDVGTGFSGDREIGRERSELNDEKVLRIIFSARFILVIFFGMSHAANSQLMCLLDCFSGYHQIWMRKEDEEKTSFITPSGTYCFVRMPE